MDIELKDLELTSSEQSEIASILARKNLNLENDLEQIWYLLDLVWDDYGCDNRNLDWERIGKFYGDPVWILNGLFIEQDQVSMKHRNLICDWIVAKKCSRVVDYGGGFGTLGRLIAEKSKGVHVSIYEPHPSEIGLRRIANYNNISVISALEECYDCLVCTDVLEHVPDPLMDLERMVKSVKIGGNLIIANHFYPVIKCHLPKLFHFRYTFDFFIKQMGCERVGQLTGSHAIIYRKVNNVSANWQRLRFMEKVSKTLFPYLEISKSFLSPIKRLICR